MSKRTSQILLLFVAVSVLATAACWNPSVTPVPITAPWDSMNLPVKENAIVWASSAKELKVVHKADKAAMLDAYEKAIVANGWKTAGADGGIVKFTKDGKSLDLELYDFENTGAILTLK